MNDFNTEDFRGKLYAPEEIDPGRLRADLIAAAADARKTRGFTQKELADVSGVRQPIIARFEKGASDPQLSTVLRLLAPLGKTLAVVPLDADEGEEE